MQHHKQPNGRHDQRFTKETDALDLVILFLDNIVVLEPDLRGHIGSFSRLSHMLSWKLCVCDLPCGSQRRRRTCSREASPSEKGSCWRAPVWRRTDREHPCDPMSWSAPKSQVDHLTASGSCRDQSQAREKAAAMSKSKPHISLKVGWLVASKVGSSGATAIRCSHPRPFRGKGGVFPGDRLAFEGFQRCPVCLEILYIYIKV